MATPVNPRLLFLPPCVANLDVHANRCLFGPSPRWVGAGITQVTEIHPEEPTAFTQMDPTIQMVSHCLCPGIVLIGYPFLSFSHFSSGHFSKSITGLPWSEHHKTVLPGALSKVNSISCRTSLHGPAKQLIVPASVPIKAFLFNVRNFIGPEGNIL